MLLLFVRLSKINGQWLALGIPNLTIVTSAAHLFSGIPAKHTRSLNTLPRISFSTIQLTLPKSSAAYTCENLPCAPSISERVRELEVHRRLISTLLIVLISLVSSYTLQLQKNEPIYPAPMCQLFVHSAHQHLQQFGSMYNMKTHLTKNHPSVHGNAHMKSVSQRRLPSSCNGKNDTFHTAERARPLLHSFQFQISIAHAMPLSMFAFLLCSYHSFY